MIDHAGRMNFPSRHPLNQTERRRALIAKADVIVGLEVDRLLGRGSFLSRSDLPNLAAADHRRTRN